MKVSQEMMMRITHIQRNKSLVRAREASWLDAVQIQLSTETQLIEIKEKADWMAKNISIIELNEEG